MTLGSFEAMAEMVEYGEADAWADYFAAAPAEVARPLGLRAERYGGAVLLMMPGHDDLFFNRVVGLGIRQEAHPQMLDEIIWRYRRAGIQHFRVQVSPAARPYLLGEWLTQHGFWLDAPWIKLFRNTAAPPFIQTDLRIEQIGPEAALDFGEVCCEVFGLPYDLIGLVAGPVGRPGWRHYLAFDEDYPAATGALYVKGERGWMGFGATRATHQRRGAQSAILTRRVWDASQVGCQWVVSDTNDDTPDEPNRSYWNLRRMGFEMAYRRENWVFGG